MRRRRGAFRHVAAAGGPSDVPVLPGETQRGVLVWDLLSMLLAVVVVHVVALYAGIGLARLCRFSRADQIAVGFAGSQKTLMVGLLVAISLQVTILPMVAYHVSQLFVDTLIADRFRKAGGEPVAGYTTRSRVWVV